MLTSSKQQARFDPFSGEAQPSILCIRPLLEIHSHEVALFGGKAVNLALLLRAGFPVPDGFCIASAFREYAKPPHDSAAEFDQEPTRDVDDEPSRDLIAAYHRLGAGVVAVRSSAAAEDSVECSFAGQQETILGVQGERELIDAVERCFQSWESRRSQAYRTRQGMGADGRMAVLVQRLVPAEVAGVLFTRDPLDPEGKTMLAEGAWGLGEVVVSGRVTPDRFWIDRENLGMLRHEIGAKPVRLTADGLQQVELERQSLPCLDAATLRELAELGRRVEQFYGAPRDIEWAFADGKLWLLQARPVTTATAFDQDQLRRAEIARLKVRAAPTGTVWARYNLAEVLPEPTPMTWGVMRRFLSGRGGYGLMFRDLGYDPDPVLDDEGFIDLVCGRPYVNLSREPKLYFRDFPLGYDFAVLKERPAAALYPQPSVNAAGATIWTWLRLPAITFRMLRTHARMRRQMTSLADELRSRIFPELAAEVAKARSVDVAGLSIVQLYERFEHWRTRTLIDFARFSLRPSIFAATSMASLENGLAATMDKTEAAVAARSLLTGVRPDPDADLAGALQSLATGKMSRDDFLQRFGHRGPGEMELSRPRWSEDPDGLSGVAAPAGSTLEISRAPSERWVEFRNGRPAPAAKLDRLEPEFRRACEFLALREAAKHYLLLGYALLRQALVEIDRRLELNGGIFFLAPEELPRLIAGESFRETIAARRKERRIALSIEVPAVIFSDDLEAIGRTEPPSAGSDWQGTPVSSGIAEGPVLVLSEPNESARALDGFILVCPSTDPAWVPLFLRAAGLIMETGGILSHGAIVAREFGLPAVVGLTDVQRRLRTGQHVRVDGNSGRIQVLDEVGAETAKVTMAIEGGGCK